MSCRDYALGRDVGAACNDGFDENLCGWEENSYYDPAREVAAHEVASSCQIAGLAASLAIVLQAQQGGGRTGGATPAGTGGALIGGTVAPARPEARGWGCQVKASINAATPRPFYNKAKELLVTVII
jgi:hypothetical protein